MVGRSTAGRGGRIEGFGSRPARGELPWQLLMAAAYSWKNPGVAIRRMANEQAGRGLVSKCDLGAINPEDTWAATGGAFAWNNLVTGEEA
jgi:hypothetical protein